MNDNRYYIYAVSEEERAALKTKLETTTKKQIARVFLDLVSYLKRCMPHVRIEYGIGGFIRQFQNGKQVIQDGKEHRLDIVTVFCNDPSDSGYSCRCEIFISKTPGDRPKLNVEMFTMNGDEKRAKTDMGGIYAVFCTIFWNHAKEGKLSCLFLEKVFICPDDCTDSVGGYHVFKKEGAYYPDYPCPNGNLCMDLGWMTGKQYGLDNLDFVVKFGGCQTDRQKFSKLMAIVDPEESEPDKKKAKTSTE